MANCCTKNEQTDNCTINLEDGSSGHRIENWLDEHPEFVQSYFTRKANRTLIDSWLHSRSHVRTPTGTPPPSGSSTPARKISASEFEGRGILKPLLSVVDGQPSFLSPTEPLRARSPHRNRKSRLELQQLDEKEVLMELVKDIANDLDVQSLCHKILQNVSLLVNGDRCSLFLVQGPREGPRYLVSKVFDVNAESKLEDVQELEEIRIPIGTGIVGYVAETGETVNIADAYELEKGATVIECSTLVLSKLFIKYRKTVDCCRLVLSLPSLLMWSPWGFHCGQSLFLILFSLFYFLYSTKTPKSRQMFQRYAM